MNNMEYSGENLLRDKLLQHEFAADEQAWEKMDELLANHFPPAPTSTAAPSGLSWVMGGKWILGVLVIGLIGWWFLLSPQPEDGDVAALPTSISEQETNISAKEDRPATFATNNASKEESDKNYNGEIKEKTLLKEFSKETIAEKAKSNYSKSVFKNKASVINGKNTIDNAEPLINNDIIPDNNGVNKPIKGVNNIIPNADSINVAETLPNIPSSLQITTFLTSRSSLLIGSQYQPVSKVPVFLTNPFSSGHRIQVGVVAGGQMAYVPQNTNEKYGGSPTVGFSVNYQLNARWSVQADVLYRMAPYFLLSSFQESRINATGQFEYLYYFAHSNDLEFYELPILIKRSLFNGNAHVLGGLRPAFVRPVHINGGGSATGAYLSSYSLSMRKGVRRFDLALTLGAEVRLWRNLWLHGRISQGLFDLSHDDFFQNNRTDITTDLHLSLRYYFLAF